MIPPRHENTQLETRARACVAPRAGNQARPQTLVPPLHIRASPTSPLPERVTKVHIACGEGGGVAFPLFSRGLGGRDRLGFPSEVPRQRVAFPGGGIALESPRSGGAPTGSGDHATGVRVGVGAHGSGDGGCCE